jgi:uncharacterized protein YkwD
MREARLNRENEAMDRALVTVTVVSAFALAACGGGGNNHSTSAPAVKPAPTGGVVSAEASKGLLGPSVDVTPGGTKVTGPGGPISPKENRPTEAQANGVAGVEACSSTSANPVPSNLAAMNAAILCLLNGERTNHGLPTLKANTALASAAKGWAGAMVARRFFAHEAGSSTPLSRVKRTGYVHGSWQIGENIAWGSGVLATPRAIVNGWMNSPGHRANILHGAFKDIGIAIKLGAPGAGLSGGATYVTDFGKHS